MNAPILAIRGVAHTYGRRRALEQVDLEVYRGRVTMLLGPNGAGKTTLFSLIARLIALQNGDIQIDGEAINTAGSGIMRKLGIVFQQPALDQDLTVLQNLTYFGRLLGLSREERQRRVGRELARLGLAALSGEPARALSGGYRRRVEIARALIAGPCLLLLDEPTVGLDPPARRSLVAFLHELAARDGIGLLWATHLIDEVQPQDDVAIIVQGRIASRGTSRDIASRTGASDLAAAFERLTQPEGAPE